MWFSRKKNKRALISRGRKLFFDQLEERTLLSIVYPVDISAIAVENGTLTANYIPVDNLSIASDAVVELTPLTGDPTESLSIKNATNDGSLIITGGEKTLGTVSGSGALTVSDGATLTVTSVSQNYVSIGAGSTLVIKGSSHATLPGGDQTGTTPDPEDCSAVMDGGTLTYNSDALPYLSIINDPILVCTDPPDVSNAWRSTTVTEGGDPILFPILGDDGTVASRDSDPSTWPPYSDTNTNYQTPIELTAYKNRFGQTIALNQIYLDTKWNDETSEQTNLLASDYTHYVFYGEGEVDSIVEEPNELVVNLSEQSSLNVQGSVSESMNSMNYTIRKQIALDGEQQYLEMDVRYGTNAFDQILDHIWGDKPPSGDWGQPAGCGDGGYEVSVVDPNEGSVYVMLYGTNESSCNTLMELPPDAGRTKVWLCGLKPNTTYYVGYHVYLTTIVTVLDPRLKNPIDRPPNGGTCVTIVPAIGEPITDNPIPTAKCSSTNPIPNGDSLYVNYDHWECDEATSDSKGKIFIITITPNMHNNGPGLVVFSCAISALALYEIDNKVMNVLNEYNSTINSLKSEPEISGFWFANITSQVASATSSNFIISPLIEEDMHLRAKAIYITNTPRINIGWWQMSYYGWPATQNFEKIMNDETIEWEYKFYYYDWYQGIGSTKIFEPLCSMELQT